MPSRPRTENRLGSAGIDNTHVGVSGIVYRRKGDTGQVNLRQADFRYLAFVETLKDCGLTRLPVSEHPYLADGLLSQES